MFRGGTAASPYLTHVSCSPTLTHFSCSILPRFLPSSSPFPSPSDACHVARDQTWTILSQIQDSGYWAITLPTYWTQHAARNSNSNTFSEHQQWSPPSPWTSWVLEIHKLHQSLQGSSIHSVGKSKRKTIQIVTVTGHLIGYRKKRKLMRKFLAVLCGRKWWLCEKDARLCGNF